MNRCRSSCFLVWQHHRRCNLKLPLPLPLPVAVVVVAGAWCVGGRAGLNWSVLIAGQLQLNWLIDPTTLGEYLKDRQDRDRAGGDSG